MIRPLLDSIVYLSQHTVLAFLGFYAIWWGACKLGHGDRVFPGLAKKVGIRGLTMVSTALVLGFILISLWYMGLPGFAGEVEPVVSSLSWMVQDGYPLYHELDAAERYSILYGPSVFLTNGLFLKVLGPSLVSVKLASSLAAIGSLLLFFAAVARKPKDPLAMAAMGLSVLYFWCQGFAVYLVRPDALLLLSVSLGLYGAVKLNRVLALITVGVILGFAMNLKIHAGLYFLPILVNYGHRFGWADLLRSLAIAAVVLLGPFALYDQVSLSNYFQWLLIAKSHGLGWASVFETSRFAIGLTLPLIVALLLSGKAGTWLKGHLVLVFSLALALLGSLLLSANPGAGMVHLLPLVPVFLYVAAQVAREISPAAITAPGNTHLRFQLGKGMTVAMVLTVALAGFVHEYRVCRLVDWQNEESEALALDLSQIQDAFPGLTLGMAVGGEQANFRHTWLRPLLVFNDNPLLVDPIAVMDCHLSGNQMPEKTMAAFTRGQVAVWLVPRSQAPFAKENWYPPHEPIFSPGFIKHFCTNYSPRSQSRFFDLWVWNGLPTGALGEPAMATLNNELSQGL